MAKRKNTKGTQKITEIVDVGNSSPPYDVASNKSNTNKINKNKLKESHTCKCQENTKSKKRRPKTWQSITDLYGDAETTKVWDIGKKRPKTLYKPEIQNKFKRRKTILYHDDKQTLNQAISTTKHKGSLRKSIISLYRKPKKQKRGRQSKTTSFAIENSNLRSPVINFKFQRRPKVDPLIEQYPIGPICPGEPCRKALEAYYNSQIARGERNLLKSDKNVRKSLDRKYICQCKREKNNEDISSMVYESTETVNASKLPGYRKKLLKPNNISKWCRCKKNVTDFPKISAPQQITTDKKRKAPNVGHGDQILPTGAHKRSNVKCKCNIVKKILKHTCKCKLDNEYGSQTVGHAGDQTGEPFFEMKVDSENLHVLNASEIKDNVKTYGRLQNRYDCICPSRMRRINRYKRHVCEKGICEAALKNKQIYFDCNCVKKVIECKDDTCDRKKIKKSKGKTKKAKCKCKFYQSPTYAEKNKPLFEVMLDPEHMNIINKSEIHNLMRVASTNSVCPTGICSVAAKDKSIELDCKCINKKLTPKTMECTEATCRETPKRTSGKKNSKSENWDAKERANNHHRPNIRPAHEKILKRENIKAKSDIHRRKGLSLNVSRDYNQRQREDLVNKQSKKITDTWCKCFCECGRRNPLDVHVSDKKGKKKKSRMRRSKCFKKRKLREKTCKDCLLRGQDISFQERIMCCLKVKQQTCERKLASEEKAFKKKEKKIMKENLKIAKKQQEEEKVAIYHWNCLTKFISGVLNLTTETIKNIILGTVSLIANPVGSYVYVRERSRNPPGTMKRLKAWIVRTWRNRSGKLSQTIKESETMNVIADQIESSAMYDRFIANKGNTKAEKAHYENKKRARQRRMTKRQDQALYGCRHMLLTTMRKTPCLWFYHICPDLYPQCLSLLTFMNNFFSVIIYLFAFLCWTPCILCFELCRAFLCCFLCTH